MVAAASSKSGSIVIDGITYTITKRTGDTQIFGQFVVPEGKTAVFYALAISSGNGDRQINLTRTIDNEIYIFDVAGGTDDYKRIESDTLSAGTYTIKVKVKSKATANYKAASKTVTFTVKVV